jgi:hypothetical protein
LFLTLTAHAHQPCVRSVFVSLQHPHPPLFSAALQRCPHPPRACLPPAPPRCPVHPRALPRRPAPRATALPCPPAPRCVAPRRSARRVALPSRIAPPRCPTLQARRLCRSALQPRHRHTARRTPLHQPRHRRAVVAPPHHIFTGSSKLLDEALLECFSAASHRPCTSTVTPPHTLAPGAPHAQVISY